MQPDPVKAVLKEIQLNMMASFKKEVHLPRSFYDLPTEGQKEVIKTLRRTDYGKKS